MNFNPILSFMNIKLLFAASWIQFGGKGHKMEIMALWYLSNFGEEEPLSNALGIDQPGALIWDEGDANHGSTRPFS